MPLISALMRQGQIHEFKASLVNKVRPRTAKATQRKPCIHKQNKTKQKPKRLDPLLT